MTVKDSQRFDDLRIELGDVIAESIASDEQTQRKLSEWLISEKSQYAGVLAEHLGKTILITIRDNSELLRDCFALLVEGCIVKHDHLGTDVVEAAMMSEETTVEDLKGIGATTVEAATELIKKLFLLDSTVEYTIRDIWQLLRMKEVGVRAALKNLKLGQDYIKSGISSGAGQPILYKGVSESE